MARDEFYKKQIDTNPGDVKQIWKIVREKTKTRNKTADIPPLLHEGVEYTKEVDKANCLNYNSL